MFMKMLKNVKENLKDEKNYFKKDGIMHKKGWNPGGE